MVDRKGEHRPMEVITARIAKAREEEPSDEERHHQELLEAIRGIGR